MVAEAFVREGNKIDPCHDLVPKHCSVLCTWLVVLGTQQSSPLPCNPKPTPVPAPHS